MTKIILLQIIWTLFLPILAHLSLLIYERAGASEEQSKSYLIGLAIGVLIFLIYVSGDRVISYYFMKLTTEVSRAL